MNATVQAYPTFDNSTPLVLQHQGTLIFTFPLSFCEFLSPQSTGLNESEYYSWRRQALDCKKQAEVMKWGLDEWSDEVDYTEFGYDSD